MLVASTGGVDMIFGLDALRYFAELSLTRKVPHAMQALVPQPACAIVHTVEDIFLLRLDMCLG